MTDSLKPITCYTTSGSITKIAGMMESMLRSHGFDPTIAHRVTILSTPGGEWDNNPRILISIEPQANRL